MGKAGLSQYVRPMIFGFVSITEVRDVKLALVSRRRTDRAGFRFTTRGMDSDGSVAIATETEAFVERAGVVTSFTTIRGSIPLFWMQFPLQMRKPRTMIHTGSREERAAFSTHFQKLSEEYGSRVVILSTLNEAGAEGILNLKYSREARRSEKIQLFKHFRFFSGETAPVTERLEDLYKDLKDVLSAQGLTQRTVHETAIRKSQSGVLRLNCIDCCDRSNVTQAHLVNSVIREFVLDDLNPTEWSELEGGLRELWYENGKQISEQYAGGAALKGDLTHYGMRTFSGRWHDLKSLMNRDFSNRYSHGMLQDGLDLLLGVVKEHDPIHLESRIRPYFPRIVIIVFVVAFVCKNLNFSRGLSVAFKLLSAMSFGGLLLVMSMPEAWTVKSALGGTKATVHLDPTTYLPLE
uniref:SAC domain-containing protein n=1 Tax=Rhodosorus marinus TaxID=101924 RepID=A0A7S3ED74_9RHOD|mmetsp:Transcript_23477/g.93131  ORF Transcript_23477/g.93131 Transcript_23477/m.93131 type:complete len:407 (+) Transcript_23477:391-1611(+)